MIFNRAFKDEVIFIRPTPSGHSFDVHVDVRREPCRSHELAHTDTVKYAKALGINLPPNRRIVKAWKIAVLMLSQKFISLNQFGIQELRERLGKC